jgi:hypothetical protein
VGESLGPRACLEGSCDGAEFSFLGNDVPLSHEVLTLEEKDKDKGSSSSEETLCGGLAQMAFRADARAGGRGLRGEGSGMGDVGGRLANISSSLRVCGDFFGSGGAGTDSNAVPFFPVSISMSMTSCGFSIRVLFIAGASGGDKSLSSGHVSSRSASLSEQRDGVVTSVSVAIEMEGHVRFAPRIDDDEPDGA